MHNFESTATALCSHIALQKTSQYCLRCYAVSFHKCALSNGAGIKGIWNLQKSSSDKFDTYLVLAFVGETRILEINAEDELDEAEIDGFDAEQQVQTHCVFAKSQSQHDFSREIGMCMCQGFWP